MKNLHFRFKISEFLDPLGGKNSDYGKIVEHAVRWLSCSAQYTGKTIHFGPRMKEHLKSSGTSAVSDHMNSCNTCYFVRDFHVTYVEHYNDRGKYSLSEREYLWDHRIKGSINLQKILKS